MGARECFELKALTYFKITVGIICLIGFLWQTILFLKYYYSHPTVLDLQLKAPEKFIFPAFTFCNANLVMRSKYCEDFPSKCSAPENMQKFCERYSHYCTRNDDPLKADGTWTFDDNFMIPKDEVLYTRDVLPTKDLKQYTQNASTFVFTTLSKKEVEGPYFYEKPGRSQLIPCFTEYSRVNSAKEPHTSFFSLFEMYSRQTSEYPAMITTMSLVIEPKEYLSPKMKPGAYFTVHSPYEAVNPHYKGVFMEPGKSYHVHIKLEEDYLTSNDNDCVDYIERWKNNMKTGARSQKMCLEKCELDYDLACYGCVSRISMFPTDHEKCLFNNGSIYCTSEKNPVGELTKCKSACQKECSKLKFHYTVEERPEIEKLFFFEDWTSRMTYISVYMEEPYITVRSRKKLMQVVESCSYFGGFLCFWLGIFILFTQVAQLLHQFVLSYIDKKYPPVA